MELYEESAYAAKHCMKEEPVPVKPAVMIMTAEVSESDYDRANLKRLAQENIKLRKRNDELESLLGKAAAKIQHLKTRNEKLEKAFIDASIK